MRFIIPITYTAVMGLGLVISHQNHKEDVNSQYEVSRRIVLHNSITNSNILSIEGFCYIKNSAQRRLNVTCKTNDNEYKDHSLDLSDNVILFVESLEPVKDEPVKDSAYHYQVNFNSQAYLPDVDFLSGTDSLLEAVTPDSSD